MLRIKLVTDKTFGPFYFVNIVIHLMNKDATTNHILAYFIDLSICTDFQGIDLRLNKD